MKNKALNITLGVMLIVSLCGYAIFKLHRINEQTKANLPYLYIGEPIQYFDLISDDSQKINTSVFNSGRPAMIFILSRPCTPCQKNLHYWRNFKEIFDDRIDFYAIALTDALSATDFSKHAKLKFKLYVPEDLNKFIQKMRLKLNLSQTILYAQNEVKYLNLGDLEGDEAVNIITLAKKLIKDFEKNNK
jgi:hypothetical protein